MPWLEWQEGEALLRQEAEALLRLREQRSALSLSLRHPWWVPCSARKTVWPYHPTG